MCNIVWKETTLYPALDQIFSWVWLYEVCTAHAMFVYYKIQEQEVKIKGRPCGIASTGNIIW